MYWVFEDDLNGNRWLVKVSANLYGAVLFALSMQSGTSDVRFTVRNSDNSIVLKCTPIKSV